MEAIRVEVTVATDGMLIIPDLRAGEEVEVIVLRKRKPSAPFTRRGGWAKGWVRILPGFDDPIPGYDAELRLV